MSDIYRIIGAEESPYSVKVRAYFRYKKSRTNGCRVRTLPTCSTNTRGCLSFRSW